MKVQLYTNTVANNLSVGKNPPTFQGRNGKKLLAIARDLFVRKHIKPTYETIFADTMKELKYKRARAKDINPTLQEPFPEFFKKAFNALQEKSCRFALDDINDYKEYEGHVQTKYSDILNNAINNHKSPLSFTKEDIKIFKEAHPDPEEIQDKYVKTFSFRTNDGKLIDIEYSHILSSKTAKLVFGRNFISDGSQTIKVSSITNTCGELSVSF